MTRHKKFLKSEKIRTKLKGSKLPKGLNVTKTEFKVRKIVIPDQLRARGADEVLSRNRLNIRDCLTRLQHNNTGHRLEGLRGLKDIVELSFEVVNGGQHLSRILGAISALAIDFERDVRREAFRVLSLLLGKAGQHEIEPFFDLLCSYLRCAMTHIQPTIQEDSLLLLDTLIAHLPDLVAASNEKILASFIDMISKLRADGQPQRTLKVRLAGKLTSSKWRTRVLDKLFALFMAVIRAKRGALVSTVQEVKMLQEASVEEIYALEEVQEKFVQVNYFDETKPYSYGILHGGGKLPDFSDCIGLNLLRSANPSEAARIQATIDAIVPLLFETWMEIRPTDAHTEEHGMVLTTEAASALKQILQIFIQFLTLLDLTAKEEANDAVVVWFRRQFLSEFAEYILPGFPFVQMTAARAKDNKEFEKAGGVRCTFQNLAICKVFFYMTVDQNLTSTGLRMLDYIQVDSRDSHINFMFSILQFVFLEANVSWICPKTKEILRALINLYLGEKTKTETKSKILMLLCKIVMSPERSARLGNEMFANWIRTLPNLLLKESVTFEVLQVLVLLSRQSNKAFLVSLTEQVGKIVENAPKIQVLNAPNELEGRKVVASLVFWIKDAEKLKAIDTSALEGGQLKDFIVDIIEERLNLLQKS